MNVLIADDEPLARLHLRRLLEAQGVTVVGEAPDAPTALERAEDLRPDAIFLDIQMPGLSGMELAGALKQLESPPLLVFVTGYAEYAVGAFDQGAQDYLLKPVSAERLLRALARLRARLTDQTSREQRPQEGISATAPAEEATAAAQADYPLRRLPVRGEHAVRLIRIEEIVVAVAREKRVFIQTTDGAEHRTYYTLTELEQWLPPDRFLRVHDSYLVGLDAVEELSLLGNHMYELRLSDGQRIPVGRTRYSALRSRLHLDIKGPEE
jgi:DNA-binding LytR/AlgR family response regulator